MTTEKLEAEAESIIRASLNKGMLIDSVELYVKGYRKKEEEMTNLNAQAKQARATAIQRSRTEKIPCDTIGILKHAAGEIVEATEALVYFQTEIPKALEDFHKPLDQIQKRNKEDLAGELADIIICALIAAANEEIDIEAALNKAQEKNAGRAKGAKV